jgi:murein DD-endopeptidase MepM/ murein hydrolase activator NlpD
VPKRPRLLGRRTDLDAPSTLGVRVGLASVCLTAVALSCLSVPAVAGADGLPQAAAAVAVVDTDPTQRKLIDEMAALRTAAAARVARTAARRQMQAKAKAARAAAAAKAARKRALLKAQALRTRRAAAARARLHATAKPVRAYRLTARFGASSGLWSRGHTGLDLAAPVGTPVRAAAAGTIVSAGWDGAYGQKIVIRHPDGTRTWYCHLSRISRRSGPVAAGVRIGAVGTTGNSTGPHLHLEVRRGDTPRDPQRWLRGRGVRV